MLIEYTCPINYFKGFCEDILLETYPNPVPVIVMEVPPPVPPRVGDTFETVGVRAPLYV